MTKKLLVILTVGAVSLGILAWRYLRPPANPLKVTIVEQGIKTTYDPVYQSLGLYGVLHAEDNAAQVAGQEVQQDEFLWQITGARYRPNAQTQWQDVPPHPFNKVSSWPVVYSMKGDLPYNIVSRFANKPGDWQISVRHIRTYTNQSGIRRALWRGSAEHILYFVLPKLPPLRDNSLVAGRSYIAGIQLNSDNSWRNIPQVGQPGFPLTVTARHTVDLRAVPKNPQISWPDWKENEEPWPRWKGNGVDSLGNGDALLDLNHPALLARHARDFKTVSANCGNTITRQILVVSTPDIFVYEPTTVVEKSKSKKTITMKIEAKVKWENGWHPPTKVHFSAREIISVNGKNSLSSKSIGEFNGPTKQDDIVNLPNDGGIAKATLTVPDNAQLIQIKALLVIPNNVNEFHSTVLNVSKLKIKDISPKNNHDKPSNS